MLNETIAQLLLYENIQLDYNVELRIILGKYMLYIIIILFMFIIIR